MSNITLNSINDTEYFEPCKVEKILTGSLGGKVCMRHKGKTLLGIVNRLLLTTSSNVLPLHLSRPLFEFLLKVKVMGSNPGYLLKSFLLYNESFSSNENHRGPLSKTLPDINIFIFLTN